MLLVRYHEPSRGLRLGLVLGDGVGDLTALDPGAFASFTELLSAARRGGMTPASYLARFVAHRSLSAAHTYAALDVDPDPGRPHLVAPLIPPEVWGAGVTYQRSREARESESKGATVYDRVYSAVRPEIFLKAPGWRVRGPHEQIGLRSDSRWQVPEPELGLVLDGEAIVGYTLGNDMSCRDIEGENPLYLPQAKIWRGSCALGPAIVLSDQARHFLINIAVLRSGRVVFSGKTSTEQMRRTFAELISYLHRDNEIGAGTVLLTGTGIVPPDDFSLMADDEVEIGAPGIGTLRNVCRPAATLTPAVG